MPAFMKIENIGVCPPEGFTVLGVSLADTSNNEGVIGQFGSGNKHAVAVLLRHDLSPVVFAGTLKLEFSTRPQTVADNQASKDFARVVVKYGGTDPISGTSRTSTEDLGFVLDYGKQDWQEIVLALREFVSNAIDRSIREKGDWSGVKVEIVDESQVRAKRGSTRVFLPMNAEVLEFFNNLGKWFLHFSEPNSLNRAILPKRNRNLGERKAAVIYRRGVRVREFESSDTESLFDYNLNDLTIDESRRASDWDVKHHCGQALGNADRRTAKTSPRSNVFMKLRMLLSALLVAMIPSGRAWRSSSAAFQRRAGRMASGFGPENGKPPAHLVLINFTSIEVLSSSWATTVQNVARRRVDWLSWSRSAAREDGRNQKFLPNQFHKSMAGNGQAEPMVAGEDAASTDKGVVDQLGKSSLSVPATT